MLKATLSNDKHVPALSTQTIGTPCVTTTIPFDFRAPVLNIGLRGRRDLALVAMPKAAVNEHGHSFA